MKSIFIRFFLFILFIVILYTYIVYKLQRNYVTTFIILKNDFIGIYLKCDNLR